MKFAPESTIGRAEVDVPASPEEDEEGEKNDEYDREAEEDEIDDDGSDAPLTTAYEDELPFSQLDEDLAEDEPPIEAPGSLVATDEPWFCPDSPHPVDEPRQASDSGIRALMQPTVKKEETAKSVAPPMGRNGEDRRRVSLRARRGRLRRSSVRSI